MTNQMTTNLSGVARSFTWTLSRNPVTLDLYTLRRIGEEVDRGYQAMPYGGMEVGGLLLGSLGPGLTISGFEPIACEYATGPSFQLSPEDKQTLAKRIAYYASRAGEGGQRVVGWYHSHTRSGLALSPDDIALHNEFFPETWQVALLLRKYANAPPQGAFFFEQPAAQAALDAVAEPSPQRLFAFEPLAFDLETLRRLETELASALESASPDTAEAGGVLLGTCQDRRLTITDFEPATDSAKPRTPPVSTEADRTVVGWYQSHPGGDLSLSRDDIQLHQARYPDPWQVALILSPGENGNVQAGFFFYERQGAPMLSPTAVEDPELKAAAHAAARELVHRDRTPREQFGQPDRKPAHARPDSGPVPIRSSPDDLPVPAPERQAAISPHRRPAAAARVAPTAGAGI